MRRWLVAAGIGVVAGLSLLTFGYAQGSSYLTDDPNACANCHVMKEQLAGWRQSSHRQAAVCNDCHTPEGTVPKYATKALNGFFHSLAFTTGWFPDRIQITPRNRRIAVESCQKCHAGLFSAGHGGAADCLRCHRSPGH
jgi:cytochrome c nitrite reductase small subunit